MQLALLHNWMWQQLEKYTNRLMDSKHYVRVNKYWTFEKWYSLGSDILIDRFPSLDEMPSTFMVCASDGARLLSRFGDLDFLGGWTPFSSKVRSLGTVLFKSRYLITLLFVSAMRILPVKQWIDEWMNKQIANFHLLFFLYRARETHVTLYSESNTSFIDNFCILKCIATLFPYLEVIMFHETNFVVCKYDEKTNFTKLAYKRTFCNGPLFPYLRVITLMKINIYQSL